MHVHDTTSGGGLDREWLHQRLGFKLGKFAMRIDNADITLSDERRSGSESIVRATIQLQVPRSEPVVATARAASARQAVSAALRSCERAFRRTRERARAKRTLARRA